MRSRGRIYGEPRLSGVEREYAEYCPRGCGNFLSEELQAGANGRLAAVLFCIDDSCGWREWTVSDVCSDLEALARQGCRPTEIATRLGLSERTVFRRIAELRAAS
ncbi:MAG: hypothetical protein FJ035_02980 [Chloroflexi bacterium]|nr:hypothetical protein [Chloroflexota bacterium]